MLPGHQHHVIGRVVDGDREAEPSIDPGGRRAAGRRAIGVERGVDEDVVRQARYRHRAASQVRRVQAREVDAAEVVQDRRGERPVDLAVRADERHVARAELRTTRHVERGRRRVGDDDIVVDHEPARRLRDERPHVAPEDPHQRRDQHAVHSHGPTSR